MIKEVEIASREIRKSREKAGLGEKQTILIEMSSKHNKIEDRHQRWMAGSREEWDGDVALRSEGEVVHELTKFLRRHEGRG